MRRSHALALLVAAFAVAPVAANAEGNLWSKDSRGSARHAPSGFVCPVDLRTDSERKAGALETVLLQTVIDGAGTRAPGEEAGCEYEGKGGSWATVEFVKLNQSETPSSRYAATRDRIRARYADTRIADPLNLKPTSPTGGKTYSTAYYNIRVGERRGSVAAVGGEVGGWMITLIQFDFDADGTELELSAIMNWQKIATSR